MVEKVSARTICEISLLEKERLMSKICNSFEETSTAFALMTPRYVEHT